MATDILAEFDLLSRNGVGIWGEFAEGCFGTWLAWGDQSRLMGFKHITPSLTL